MSNFLRYFTFSLCLFFISCSDSNSVKSLNELKGLTDQAIISKLGNPDSENLYRMDDEVVKNEINGKLLSYFPADSSVIIRDMTWNESGYKIKVWLHEEDSSWKVVDAIKFSDNVRF